jgi:hypothetical protein
MSLFPVCASDFYCRVYRFSDFHTQKHLIRVFDVQLLLFISLYIFPLLSVCCDLEKVPIENDFHLACLRSEIFLRELTLKSEKFPLRA